MKIAILSFYSGKYYRGVETYVDELSQRLKKFGYQVSIHKNIRDHVNPATKIVVSTNGRFDAILAKLWCLIHRAKLIIPGQSGIGWDDKLNLWMFPDIFVGLTKYQCNWAKKINPLVKTVRIPNGVDLNKFNPQVKPLNLNKHKPIILNVGAVRPSKPGEISKHQDLLVKAAAKIKASVLLVGKGGDMSLSHDQMPGVYTACDIFSYPTSPRESFGIAMLEAMASGLPIVANDDPIRREIVGDAGLFVNPTDTDAFAKAIQKAVNTNWGDKPRRQAAKFSWDKIAQDYDRLFTQVIK